MSDRKNDLAALCYERGTAMKKVIVVGSLNMDMCINAPYCPKGGETLTGGGFMTNAGGKGANQATAAGKLGARVLMCGCVGEDAFAGQLIDSLRAAEVDTQFVRRQTGVCTGIAVILVTGGENRIILDKGANACLCEEDIDRVLEHAEAGDIYLTQLENPVEMIGYGLRRAKEKGLYTILNPAPADPSAASFFRYADLITPNESELEILGGKEKIFAAGVRTIVTTLGSRGYEIADTTSAKEYPCLRVRAVDTTAAGDTVCGGLAAELARGASLEEAMAFASKAASIACTRKGAAQSVPTREEVDAFRLNR